MKTPAPHDGQVFLAWVTFPLPKIQFKILPSTEYNERVSPGIFLWICLFFFFVVYTFFFFFFLPPSRSDVM
jgi:hypothetical protein